MGPPLFGMNCYLHLEGLQNLSLFSAERVIRKEPPSSRPTLVQYFVLFHPASHPNQLPIWPLCPAQEEPRRLRQLL